MKAGTSTLNPYAESYVPFSKRGGLDGKNDVRYAGAESKASNEGSVFRPQPWDPTSQGPQSYNVHGYDGVYVAENFKLKGHSGHVFHGSSSYNAVENTGKAIQDDYDYVEMDMDYLQWKFPGVADEVLSEIYLTNEGDVDSAIDVLTHLELSVDSSEQLPGTLDIGDVPEGGNATEIAAEKVKNVNIESGASSSGLSGADPVV